MARLLTHLDWLGDLGLHVGISGGRVRVAIIGGSLLLVHGEPLVGRGGVQAHQARRSSGRSGRRLPRNGLSFDAPALRTFLPQVMLDRNKAGQTGWVGEVPTLNLAVWEVCQPLPELAEIFRHELIGEVAYHLVMRPQRRGPAPSRSSSNTGSGPRSRSKQWNPGEGRGAALQEGAFRESA